MCKHLISLVKQALNTNSRITKYILVLFTMIIFYPVSGWSEIITLNPTQDTYVYINFPTTSYGSNTLLQTTSNQQFKREALLQFDLSGIPQGAQIVSAHLELYSDSIPKTDTATRVYANSSSWSETTTWNTKPSRALSPNFEDSIPITSAGQFHQWDITELVQDWVDGVETNYGVTISAEGNGNIIFRSSEASSNLPVLDIEFVTNNPFKFSTGRTFDIICTTQAETDDTIRSLATSGVCHGFMDTWSPHGNLIKNTTGNTADFVIPYFNFGNNNPIEGSTHDTNWYDFVNANHPEWFLREKTSTGCNGRRIRVSREVAEELMDRGSVGAGSTLNPSKYVDAWIKELINTYQANNWDGVWADNVNLLGNIQTEYCYKNTNGSCGSGIVVPCNPRTGQNYTAAEWRGDTLKALKRARELLDPYNLFFMAQTAGRWWREYDETIPPQIEDLADSAYMLQIENFAIDYGDMLHTFVDWIEQMAAVQDILKNRLATVVFRTVRSNRDPTTDEKFFRDASWLLVKEFNMMQRTFIKRGLNALDPWWLDTNLGAPQGDMFVVNVPQATQVRRRNYQNGIVLVNPHDTSSYSITVDRSGCVDVQTGQSRPQGSTINMTPKKGVILKNCS